jgi:phage I-like protein
MAKTNPSPVLIPAASPALGAMAALAGLEVAAQGQDGAGAAAGAELLEPNEQWVHLVPAGTTAGRDGRGPYTLDAPAVVAAFAQHGADLPVDYEHQSLGAAAKSGPVPAAGWINAVQPRPDGLWGRVAWTAQAAQLLKDKAYRYLSAVFDHLPDGRVVKLRGAGLVHAPNLVLQAAASEQAPGAPATFAPITPPTDLPTTPAAAAAQGKTMSIEELKAQVAALTEQLAQAKTQMSAQGVQLAQANAAAAAATAAQSAGAAPNPAQWVPMGQYQAVTAQLTALQSNQSTNAVAAAVTAAMSAGKVAPAQKDWATAYASQDLKGFEAFVAASPVIVSAQAQGAPAPGALTAAQGALSDSDFEIASLLGIEADDFAKSKATQAAQAAQAAARRQRQD